MTPAAIKSDALRSERAAGPAEIVAAIRSVVGPSEKPVGLHEPKFAGNEWAYVKDCLDTGWVSYNGAYVTKFEQMLCDLTGAASCAAVANGTVAIEIALRVAGVKADEEVLSPSLTFVATNNAIVHVGAVPHFIDSDERTLGMDPAALADYLKDIAEPTEGGARHRRTGRRLAAILPMHVFGHPVDMDALNEIAERWRIPVIEDAAEAIGSTYKGRAAGNLAPIAAMSFNGNRSSRPAAAVRSCRAIPKPANASATSPPRRSSRIPGSSSTTRWPGTSACPTSTPPWAAPGWSNCRISWRRSVGCRSAMSGCLPTCRGCRCSASPMGTAAITGSRRCCSIRRIWRGATSCCRLATMPG